MLRTVVARQRCGEVRARSALISVRLSGKTVLTHGPDVHTVRHTQSPCGVECEKKASTQTHQDYRVLHQTEFRLRLVDCVVVGKREAGKRTVVIAALRRSAIPGIAWS